MAKRTTNRGGRKKGQWTETTPDTIRDFRRIGRISRSRLASALGVSATSVQNWEVGLVVATPAMQKKIVELIKASPELGRPRPAQAGNGGAGGAEVEAAGQIVCAWLEQHPGTDSERLLALIRAVRTALL
jgi:DNA-binding transcriptional regulator YiaG